LEGVVTISFPLLFCGVATPAVVVADFLEWGPFVGTFAFDFVPLEEGEEGFLVVVRCDGFFGGDSVDKHRCQLGYYDRSSLVGIYVYLQKRRTRFKSHIHS